jgi:hypothetical protein
MERALGADMTGVKLVRRPPIPSQGRFRIAVGTLLLTLALLVPAGSSATPPGLSESTYTYDVSVVGTILDHEDYTGTTNACCDGTVDLELAWTLRFKNLKVKVQKLLAAKSTFLSADPTTTSGDLNGHLRFDGKVPGNECSGQFDVKYKVTARARADTRGDGRSKFSFKTALAVKDSAAFDQQAVAAQKACPKGYLGTPKYPEKDYTLPGGPLFEAETALAPPTVYITREGKKGMPYPVKQITEGKSFSIDTGKLLGSRDNYCSPQSCTKAYTFRVVVKFTRKR